MLYCFEANGRLSGGGAREEVFSSQDVLCPPPYDLCVILAAFCCIHQACQLLSGSSSSAVIHCNHPSKSLITSSHSTPLGLKIVGDQSQAITCVQAETRSRREAVAATLE